MALSLLGLGFVVGVGATGYLAAQRLASEVIAVSGSALKSQLQADMAHDALRADVLAALLAGARKDASDEKTIRGDLQEHAETFDGSLKTLVALPPLDSAMLQAVQRLRPALSAYLETATSVTARLSPTPLPRRRACPSSCAASRRWKPR